MGGYNWGSTRNSRQPDGDKMLSLNTLLHPHAPVPARLADVVVEAALDTAWHTGAFDAHHDIHGDLQALLRESIDRGAPDWIQIRLDELAEQYLDAAEDHAENADARLDVMKWLMHRSPLNPLTLRNPNPAPQTPTTLPVVATTSRLTLLPALKAASITEQ
jgi:hypothetical protein